MTDKTPFFIRPFHTKAEDKKHPGQENEKTVLFRYSEGRIFWPIQAQSCLSVGKMMKGQESCHCKE